MAGRIPLYYTFGNHMHWVDMQWLWGYHVLPGCVRDMLDLCREAGVKGCVNFDGIGYEKLAAEDPEAFASLRAAIQSGLVEVVGGSYGQPYGQFHGGESNVRQRIFGSRVARRLFGVPVKTFWEEEFDFFPQLPQMLAGVGIEFSSLFFQWTWHTPEVPREDAPVVWWEGQDGSRLLCATRNKLNLHQWPEDMALTFASLADGQESGTTNGPVPLVLQWLELMPSPDWMCRSELILPKLRELMSDDRFEIRAVTLGEYLGIQRDKASDVHSGAGGDLPVRRYTMDQVWHGMTLGKNADLMRRESRKVEGDLLNAETWAAIAGLFGRPYAQWDVYPTWELEEAWRELLSAQHHDNDECEGLCGYVGQFSYERSKRMSRHIAQRNIKTIARRIAGDDRRVRLFGPQARTSSAELGERLERPEPAHKAIVFNPLGWARRVELRPEGSIKQSAVVEVPAFGFVVADISALEVQEIPRFIGRDESTIERYGIRVHADLKEGFIRQIVSPEFPEGSFLGDGGFGFHLHRNQERVQVRPSAVETYTQDDPPSVGYRKVRYGDDDVTLSVGFSLTHPAVVARIHGYVVRPDPGLNASLQTSFRLNFKPRLVCDQPYGVAEIEPTPKGLKKYPTGDWMTSPQWFEEVHNAFTSLTLVDLVDADNPGRGLLIAHDGSQQWFLDEDNTVRCVLSAYDPWDENYFHHGVQAGFVLAPHGEITHSQRWKLAQEVLRQPTRAYFDGEVPGPRSYSAASCDSPNVVLTAFYRETRDSAKGQTSHAADLLRVDYPYVVRMVELDGIETEATLAFEATVAGAVRTNLLGEPSGELAAGAHTVRLKLRPYEIATVYLDLVEGRKQVRDLDAKREIWATVHRVD